MSATNRGIIFTAVVSLLAIPSFVGCGSDDYGKWEPTPPASSPSGTVTGVGEVEKTPGLISTSVKPDISSGNGPGVAVVCRIPESLGQPELFAPSTKVDVNPLTSTNGRVCFGRNGDLGLSHCRWVNAQEARYRAIAECHKAALEQLEKLGLDAMDNNRERWFDKKVELVPAAWALNPRDATADVGQQAGWISLLMDSERKAVPAAPFCFGKERGVTLRHARDATMFSLWWLSQTREAKSNWTLSALKRGVKFMVNPNGSPVEINVQFITIPAKRSHETCSFDMPGA